MEHSVPVHQGHDGVEQRPADIMTFERLADQRLIGVTRKLFTSDKVSYYVFDERSAEWGERNVVWDYNVPCSVYTTLVTDQTLISWLAASLRWEYQHNKI